RLYKKGEAPPRVTLTYPDAVLGALCWGWIDGQAKKHDEASRIQRFTPRRKRSVWSKLNVERAERLIAEGRMQPPGFAAIDAAKADGRWDAAYDTSADVMPGDFLVALADRPDARAFFETLPKSARFPIVFRLQTAVKPETRARRLATLLDKLDRGERP
ncbi:MAG TPA: YdeI/OmpD-associated family protein, partial [Acidimicrobiales bacterium]|nr:YdeI/OmpD-associated family protein [Acidimicrobiales bacterium]